ncbi:MULTISPECIES: acyl-homoserine-lactone synthase [unclassified Streptosporangium]|uniref:acyl-homoserine-lactone synthase n=1 Tax=unclassified Streptosporangium TaxID=2632669 RepID=UPI002E2CD07A|nr:MULTISPECIES: acyl-homoserine-lactone synthase [unclassified Streptosporangium]
MDDPPPRLCAQRIIVGRAGELPAWLLDGMFRLRHEVFYERLRWDVDSVHGMERDFYDDCDPVYVISYRVDCQEVTGCCRLLPTDGRYMLPEVFSETLRGGAAPRDPAIWELSRLATGRGGSRTVAAGLGPLARALLWKAFRWVDRHGEAVVAVSGVALERSVNAMGVPTRRLGDGQAARLGKLLCSAYITSTRDFLENAPPVPEMETDCHGGCAAARG